MINKVHNMDCLEGLRLLEDNSIDSIVTDPPYELGFMGKAWDSTGIAYNVELWKQCLRVLKPGGHLLSFGGTRTYHRMACAIEDAGFEVRDSVHWMYSQGFPKSMDVSKAIDKQAGATREVIGINHNHRSVSGVNYKGVYAGGNTGNKDITAPSTPSAIQWQGYGTALKPAHEPIVLARKPISERTIASNVLRWGCGGLNIDGCRVGTETIVTHGKRNGTGNSLELSKYTSPENYEGNVHQGRFPANVILDNDAGKALDEQSGVNASRFFYNAKASKADRGIGNIHPTVKPQKLMEYLVTLITPPQGIVLDPFAGSGSTLVAAEGLGFQWIGFEMNKEYCDICDTRLSKDVPLENKVSQC